MKTEDVNKVLADALKALVNGYNFPPGDHLIVDARAALAIDSAARRRAAKFQPAGEAAAPKANAGHPALQKLIDSIEIVDGKACWDYEYMYEVRDALNAPPAQIPAFVRKRVERAISEAVNPKGMSVHDGMARVPACDLQMLLNATVHTPEQEQPANIPVGIDDLTNSF